MEDHEGSCEHLECPEHYHPISVRLPSPSTPTLDFSSSKFRWIASIEEVYAKAQIEGGGEYVSEILILGVRMHRFRFNFPR